MKKCRGQFPCEKQVNKEIRRFSKYGLDYSSKENDNIYELPKNPDKPLTMEQRKRNGHIQYYNSCNI